MEQKVMKQKGRLQKIYQLLKQPSTLLKQDPGVEIKTGHREWSPEVIRIETKNAYLITIKLIGVDKESILVKRVGEDSIRVDGKRKAGENLPKSERKALGGSGGTFHLHFELADNASDKGIEASFKNGMLTLRIPKIEKSQPQAYHIKVH